MMITIDKLIHFSNHSKNLHLWENLFKEVLKNWGFNKTAQDKLFEWGKYGHNWEKLHENSIEEDMPANEVLNQFFGEVDYCSDRMSLDRLFRCHWLYNLYLRKTGGEI